MESVGSYEEYLESLLIVWKECNRVLRANGKIAINTPIMPIPKSIIRNQHTRHIKNINNDIEGLILQETDFQRFSLYIWQKQTSKLMFGSYPYPGNILENNTVEFINVYVKPGKPPKYSEFVRESNKILRDEWIDLTQQIWFMYPKDVKREQEHPAPFPDKLPGRIIRMYTYGSVGEFRGDVVLDPFCGTGTTCAVARRMGRRFVGIDIAERYISFARNRLERAQYESPPVLIVGRPRFETKEALERTVSSFDLDRSKQKIIDKHKRRTYGRSVYHASPSQLGLDLGNEFSYDIDSKLDVAPDEILFVEDY